MEKRKMILAAVATAVAGAVAYMASRRKTSSPTPAGKLQGRNRHLTRAFARVKGNHSFPSGRES